MARTPWTYPWTRKRTRLAVDGALDRFALSHGEALYLAQLTTCDLVAFPMVHATDVGALLFIGDEEPPTLWSGDDEGRVAVVNALDGARVAVLATAIGEVRALCRAGPRAVAAFGARGAVLLDANEARTPRALMPSAPAEHVTAAVSSGDALALGTEDGRVQLWSPGGGAAADAWSSPPRLVVSPVGAGGVTALALSSTACACARGADLAVHALADGRALVHYALPPAARCVDLAFSPGGDALVAACADGALRVWTRDPSGAWPLDAEVRPIGEAPDCAAVRAVATHQRPVIVSAHEDAIVRAQRLAPREDHILAQTHFEQGYWLDRRDGLNGRNPGMWRTFFPARDAQQRATRDAQALAAFFIEELRRPEGAPRPTPAQTEPPRDARADGLYTDDAERRAGCAESLASSEDPRVVALLEKVVLEDSGSYSVEGAFVDGTEWVYPAAARSLAALYRRFPPDVAQTERLRGLLASPATNPDRLRPLCDALGEHKRAIVAPLLTHARAEVRVRARMVLHERGPFWSAQLSDEDEELRLAVLALHPYTNGLLSAALARYPREPSAHVRAAILDLWLRYQKLMAGTPRAHELGLFQDDADETIRARMTAWLAMRSHR